MDATLPLSRARDRGSFMAKINHKHHIIRFHLLFDAVVDHGY